MRECPRDEAEVAIGQLSDQTIEYGAIATSAARPSSDLSIIETRPRV